MPSELTTQVLIEIRDEARVFRAEMREFKDEMYAFRDRTDQRFDQLESTVADLATQVFMTSRLIRKLVEDRDDHEVRLDDLEKRVFKIESDG